MSEFIIQRWSKPTATKQQRIVRVFFLLLTFTSGAVVGAVGGSFWTRRKTIVRMQHPEQIPDQILPRLQSELALSQRQYQLVSEIVRRRHSIMESLRADAFPKQMAEFRTMRNEVAAILTSAQRDRWGTIVANVEQRYIPVRPVGPPPGDLIFYRFDASNDGSLTEDEVPPGVWRRLQFADGNEDGAVSRQEYSACITRHSESLGLELGSAP